MLRPFLSRAPSTDGIRPAIHLQPRGSSGIWEGFVPNVRPGDAYKYHVVSRYHGYEVDKADPFAFHAETPPHTASIVWNLDYEWQDQEWMASRASRNSLSAPISIYEIHFGSWRRVPEEDNRFLSLPGDGAAACGIPGTDGLYSRRVPAADRAPVLWFVGISDDRIFCGDEPLWYAPGSDVSDRLSASTPDLLSSSTGCHRTFQPTTGRWVISMGHISSNIPIREKESTRIGTATSSITAGTKCAVFY